MSLLQLGSNGPEVITLQNQLKAAGYPIATDGSFGPATETAVKSFQQQHGLTPDGIVGPETQAALVNLTATNLLHGIDISHYTSSINWSTLNSETSFVYCKASQGGTFKDPTLKGYLEQLQKAQIPVGGYHFLTFQDSVQNQVDNFLGCGIDYSQTGILPPVLDIEWQSSSELNQYIQKNSQQCIELIGSWLSQVQTKTGRLPMIYTNPSFWKEYFNNPVGFSQYMLWIAVYQSSPPANIPNLSPYKFWQNSQNGKINSIGNPVDTNIFFGSQSDLQVLAKP